MFRVDRDKTWLEQRSQNRDDLDEILLSPALSVPLIFIEPKGLKIKRSSIRLNNFRIQEKHLRHWPS